MTPDPSNIQLGIVRGISYGLFGPPDSFAVSARALGARFMRVDLYWSQIEPRPGVYTWSTVDALLDQSADVPGTSSHSSSMV